MSQKSPKILSDVELVCQIILAFYSFPLKSEITAVEITDCINKQFDVEESRVYEVLKTMASQRVIGSGKLYKEEAFVKERFSWCIDKVEDDIVNSSVKVSFD